MRRHLAWLAVAATLVTRAAHGMNVTNRFEFSHTWLHHEMRPEELSAHFGLFDAGDVDPESYRVITVNHVYNFDVGGE
jgi:hypothetical protein